MSLYTSLYTYTPPSAPRTLCSRSCRPRSTCDTSRSRNYTAPPPATVHVTVHVTVHIHSTERAAHAVLRAVAARARPATHRAHVTTPHHHQPLYMSLYTSLYTYTPPSAPRTPCSRSCRPRSTCDTSRSRNYTAPPPATVHVTVHVTVHIHSTERAAHAVLAQLPPALDLRHIALTYPVSYKESLNTVLIQEAIRYNRLLGIINNSLRDLLKALKGLVVMSEALESMANSMARNAVPLMWSSKAYPSLKPLAAWVKDLCLRVQFMQGWADTGIPKVFWISGFYFPQAFLTGALQNYARKHVIAIDTISYAFEPLASAPLKKPEDGCCVRGLFLEGARWNSGDMTLEESRPKELHTEMAIIYMKPEQGHKGVYMCPAYKTLVRAGTLSTTGHSTNYVMTIELPTHKPQPHWIKRGVALFCALDY
ncbi:dynein heavy chain 1, axonemal-like [Manduca sexta]|uniref:dynein heavy chain 1, axonemal-like n=1 Tax=Manduca sexta TaxID=7130 RepID=UPI0018901B7D|nr:dynein heavy chain 1, axonemal-like [Manduca sexta]